MTRKKTPPTPKPRKAIHCRADDDPEVTHRNYAQAIIAPEVGAFRIVSACEQPGLKDQLDTPAMIRLLKDRGEAVNQGDMTHAEQMLAAQATALQTLFVRLSERAMEQGHTPNIEAFMRLALRAQSQSRATLETLATIKNPPMIFAKQANVTTGPQQINNGTVAGSCARENETEQSKLFEVENGQRLDTRAPGATIRTDPAMATVGTIDGTANR
ncbi:hypothetical protein [Aromatoleum bremense]|uniref:Terminase small subunit n=1 Tax=Aromatoleum bremense TaxID=76115 RepID=A0ABX1NVR8_9RHOO|nr:hypothetical protein [Aromatoleum bremense]NMG15866.1 hypothetical protein [Aromatoleum bremense]QTQ32073.1 Uncharacterized protein pbN1_20830 [Aromatoleum bremense]